MFAHTPGFKWLRMEPADDLGLGLMLKEAGARARLLNGDGLVRVEWYHSVGGMMRGFEKNGFGPSARYSALRLAAIVVYLLGLVGAPPLALALGILEADALITVAGAIAVLVNVGVAIAIPRKSAGEILAFLLLPVGSLLIALIVLRAAYICSRNGGIDWRGTHYPIEALRSGQRVKF
jgi:hypothetical protein